MVFIIIFLGFIFVVIFVYNIIPGKSKDVILSKRMKQKTLKTSSKKKEPVKEYLEKIIDYLEIKSKKWKYPFLNSYKDSLSLNIQKAGNPNGMTADRLFAIQLGAMIGTFIFYVLILYYFLDVLSLNVVYGSLSLILGFIFPKEIWLKDLIKKRTKAILKELPDTIDLFTLCVEAGLDFSAAIKKIIEKGKECPLRDEFIKFEKETNMGASRIDALRNMANRNDIEDLNSFLVSLIQAVKMGTSLGPILRSQSQQLRIRRSQRVEKMAAEAPVKMLIPLILCIFPAVFIILFTPIIMQLYNMK